MGRFFLGLLFGIGLCGIAAVFIKVRIRIPAMSLDERIPLIGVIGLTAGYGLQNLPPTVRTVVGMVQIGWEV